jgi:hypothetical protein
MNTLFVIIVAIACVVLVYLILKGQKDPVTTTSTTTLAPPSGPCSLYKISVKDDRNFLSYISCDGTSVDDSGLPVGLENVICCKTGSITGSGMEIIYAGECEPI